MSYYSTPRRRHSSLFERMENEIKKISKKLSAAKESYRGSSTKPKNNNHFMSYNSVQDRNPPTVRKSQQTAQATQALKHNTAYIKRRINSSHQATPQVLNFDEALFEKTTSNANKIILKLQDQNSKLSYRLGKMQAICQDQSYKLGYVKAELKQKSKQLAIQKEKQLKETSYLTTLLEHYRNKTKKYKKILRQSSEVSIDIGSDSNM